ncbi:hypothetical protein Q8A73_006306 [Channa argus]|nr:hypothetical protein Q8A73_006306 [Channa argus]
MNSATVNWEGRFQRVKSRLALWKARKLTLLGKVLVLKADMLSSVLHLAYVFPLPVAIRRPLARTIFDFLWGGRYEWVARGRMMSGLAEGHGFRGGNPASLGMKYFFLYAARGILNWSNVSPRSEQLPWHYTWVAKWLRAHPEALEDGIWKQQRVLYRVVRGKVNPSPLLGVPSSVWVGVQAVGLSNGLKDLNWACLHRTLPVRDKIHRHGLGRSRLCPRPSCGAGETAYHVMWEFSFARQLWAKAKKVVGRAKPDLTLTWQVVERGFVGAHIRSGWGILWLLLSLYKRGLWLARQELVRNGVEWSTERVAKGVEWEVTERIRWDVDKLGYHAAKEKWKGPVNSSGGTAQDFEVPVEEQRQGSDANGVVLHQNHQGPVESDGGGRFLYSVASAGNRLRLIRLSLQEAIRADASVRVTLVPGGGDLRVKLSQYADDTTLLLDSDECVVRALELFEDFGRVSGARLNIGKCTVKGGGRGVMLLRVDYQRTCSPLCSTWHLVRNGVEWSTEGVAKGVEWEVTERMKWDVDKLGYHAAKEKWKGGFGLL